MHAGIDSKALSAPRAADSPRPSAASAERSTAFVGESFSYRAPSGSEVDVLEPSSPGARSSGVVEETFGSMASRRRNNPYPKLARIRRCDTVADLADIFLPDVAVAYWPRRTQPTVEAYLKAVLASGALGSGGRWILEAEAEHAFPELPDRPGKRALCQDIAYLGRVCTDLVGCTRLGVRIEVLDRAMCPRFHVDRVGLRLLCTYLGPGTEYLDSPHPTPEDGSAGSSRTAEAMPGFGRGERIVRFPRDAVVVLKGEAWPGNEGRGAVHRSPALRGHDGRRVLLAIDPLE